MSIQAIFKFRGTAISNFQESFIKRGITHGLVYVKEKQSTGIKWYAGTYGNNTQAKGDGPFAGRANTAIIIVAHLIIGDDGSTYAARVCNELQITEGGITYGDWYLPSKQELNLIYTNKGTINTTAGGNGANLNVSVYWSSKEVDSNNAWVRDTSDGSHSYYNKTTPLNVRAVRAF
jgi:hypothetical protein